MILKEVEHIPTIGKEAGLECERADGPNARGPANGCPQASLW